MKIASFGLILLTLINIQMPHIQASETREIKRFCKRTRNYKKCIKEFQGYEKTKQVVKTDKPIEIEVIPYKY